MASQLRFEGPELEALLGRVREEIGVDAHIVAANRVRKGGFGGFFAREGYEVVVDVTENAASNGANPRSQRQQQQRQAKQRTRVPASVLDLAEEINDTERDQVIDLEHPPRVSTEKHDFGAMLEQLTRALDEEEADMPLPGPRAASMTMPEEETPVDPRAHYRRVTRPAADVGAALNVPRHDRMPQPDVRLAQLGLPPAMVPSIAAADDLRTAIVQRLAQLPPPPMLPRTAGVVVAVVGIGTAPIALARRIADELEIDQENIVLATPEPMGELSHPDEAEAFRRSCRRRPEPTVIAISSGAGRAQLGWAHRMLDRLEPTVTWAAVEASVKPDDISHRVTLLGGVDVLALTGVADTVSPAAVLALGIPVGRIGAKHATPAAWADLLMERLER